MSDTKKSSDNFDREFAQLANSLGANLNADDLPAAPHELPSKYRVQKPTYQNYSSVKDANNSRSTNPSGPRDYSLAPESDEYINNLSGHGSAPAVGLPTDPWRRMALILIVSCILIALLLKILSVTLHMLANLGLAIGILIGVGILFWRLPTHRD